MLGSHRASRGRQVLRCPKRAVVANHFEATRPRVCGLLPTRESWSNARLSALQSVRSVFRLGIQIARRRLSVHARQRYGFAAQRRAAPAQRSVKTLGNRHNQGARTSAHARSSHDLRDTAQIRSLVCLAYDFLFPESRRRNRSAGPRLGRRDVLDTSARRWRVRRSQIRAFSRSIASQSSVRKSTLKQRRKTRRSAGPQKSLSAAQKAARQINATISWTRQPLQLSRAWRCWRQKNSASSAWSSPRKERSQSQERT